MHEKSGQNRRKRMQDWMTRHFAGRQHQRKAFEKALDAVQGRGGRAEDAKINIAVSGEGGMGKTWLLGMYETICKARNVQPIYIDFRPYRDPGINTLTDFMLILREHLGQLPIPTLIGRNPFRDFDKARDRFLDLEKRQHEQQREAVGVEPSGEKFAKLGASLVVRAAEQISPDAGAIISAVGEQMARDITQTAISETGVLLREPLDRLRRIFSNEEFDFYLRHEDELIEKLSKAMEAILERYVVVILIDSYEDLMQLDIKLREHLLEKLPGNFVLVLAGRNSIERNCSPLWRSQTEFFELTEFKPKETGECLQKLGVRNRQLKESIHLFTRGVPMAVGLAGDISERIGEKQAITMFQKGNGRQPKQSIEVIHEVAERFLNLVPKEELGLIRACAVLGRISRAMLEHVLGLTIDTVTFDDLERYSFIRRDGSDYVFHSTVRAYTLASFKGRDREEFNKLQRRALGFAEEKLSSLRIKDEDKFENEDYRDLRMIQLYHLLQLDPKLGKEELYSALADAMWNRKMAFSLGLIALLRLPLETELPGANAIESGCAALLAKHYEAAVQAWEDVAKLGGMSARLDQVANDTLGDLLGPDSLGKPDLALIHYEHALKHFRAFKETARMATTLMNMAECYESLKKWDQAIQRLEEAAELRVRLGDQKGIGYASFRLGIVFQSTRLYERAVRALEESRDQYVALERWDAVAGLWNALGDTYQLWDKQAQAMTCYQEALKRYEELDNKAWMAGVRWRMGLSYQAAKDYAAAVKALEESRDQYVALERWDAVADLWNALGDTYRLWDKQAQAMTCYQEALKRYEELDNKADIADVRHGMGLSYWRAGKFATAFELLAKSRSDYEGLGEQLEVASLHNSIGLVYRSWGKFEQSSESFRNAEAVYQSKTRKSDALLQRLELATTESAAMNPHAALTLLRQVAEDELDLSDDERFEVNRLVALLFAELGYVLESRSAVEKLTQQAIMKDTKVSLAKAFEVQARVFSEFEEIEEASLSFEKALALYKDLHDKAGEASLRYEIGRLQNRAGEGVTSAELLTEATSIFRDLGRPLELARSLTELAKAHKACSMPFEESLAEAIRLFEEIDRPDEAEQARLILNDSAKGN